MNLYILRHASAGTKRVNPLLDRKRPLDKEGKQQCLRLAHVLGALKINFDLILSSPLKRALQTAQFVATETGYEAQIALSDSLSPTAGVADFQELISGLNGHENVLVVGHNPNLQTFLGSLLVPATGDTQPVARVRLRKSTLARVQIDRGGDGTLQLMLDPRTVRGLYATSTTRSRRKTSRK